MTAAPDCHAPVSIGAPPGSSRIALVGNPNAGKSTLFNALTGGGAPTGNYAGTTVDRQEGRLVLADRQLTVIDVPGTYSLAARSPEERIAIDTVLGLAGGEAPELLVVVLDAPRLQRSMYLLLQLLDLHLPVVVALNLMDEARTEGRPPNAVALAEALGVPVVPIVARSGEGLTQLRDVIADALTHPRPPPGAPHKWSAALLADAERVAAQLPPRLANAATQPDRAKALAIWLLLSVEEDDLLDADLPRALVREMQKEARDQGRDLVAEIVGQRYAWIDANAARFVVREGRGKPISDKIDAVVLHPVYGSIVFFVVMAIVFQALFSWSDPAIGLIESLFAWVGGGVSTAFAALSETLPLAGWTQVFGDFVVDGLIGGVGSVLVFIPQIALLFLFIALLEDSGYLARAAHLMDRVLRAAGLPGRAFVPLLSGFACAVPAILATRTMPRFRDRLLTMAVLPLTSCSARLPVYTLLIAALFPQLIPGTWIPARPVALFAMYMFSTLVTVIAATILGRTLFAETTTPDLIELPPYRIPHWKTVGLLVKHRVGDFIREAGRVILVATVVLWALLYFPRYTPEEVLTPEVVARAELNGEDLTSAADAAALERSYAGQFGHLIEPAIAPLGFDWQIGIGLIGSFAAREVFVATMGVVYGLGEVDETSTTLRERMQHERREDGSPRYTPLVATSLMVFFALAFQCLSTFAVLRRETQSWRWPVFIVGYLTVLSWLTSFAIYQGGRLLGYE